MSERKIIVKLKASSTYLEDSYMLSEVNGQIVSSIFGIIQYTLSNFTMNNEVIYFFIQNTLQQPNNYMDGLLKTIELYKIKANSLEYEFSKMNYIYFFVGFGFTFVAISIVLIIYITIRKSKLFVMSFFIHIPSKSLEEIITNCDEFVAAITLNDFRTIEPEGSEHDILESQDEESGSSMTFKQQSFYKGYKKHHSRQNRNLKDTCAFLLFTIAKFLAQFLLVACYFISYFFVAYSYHGLLRHAGLQVSNNSLVELDSINILVLLKESIANDTNSLGLSTSYYQLNSVLDDTIYIMKGLEDVLII